MCLTVAVLRDGVEALDYLFCTGAHAGRDSNEMSAIVSLDLKLPKMDGLEVLAKLRADRRTKLLPVIILISFKEEEDVIHGYKLGANSYVRKPVDFEQFSEAVQQLKLYWFLISEPLPPNQSKASLAT